MDSLWYVWLSFVSLLHTDTCWISDLSYCDGTYIMTARSAIRAWKKAGNLLCWWMHLVCWQIKPRPARALVPYSFSSRQTLPVWAVIENMKNEPALQVFLYHTRQEEGSSMVLSMGKFIEGRDNIFGYASFSVWAIRCGMSTTLECW